MARGDSTIKVNIIGDAKGLASATTAADKSIAGIGKRAAIGVGGVIAGLAVADKALEFFQGSLDAADRAGDATARLNLQLGEIDASKLTTASRAFTDIGVSGPDFLEIAAGFTDIAKATTDLDSTAIADMAPNVAALAGALGRLRDQDPAELGTKIATFISGARGAAAAAKELGVPFDSALTPAQRYAQLMERLPGLLAAVTGENAGLDDKQAALNAKFENFQADIGPGVEIVLSGILDFLGHIADDIPRTIKGFEDMGGAVIDFGRTALGPLGNVRDALEGLIGLTGDIAFNLSHLGQNVTQSELELARSIDRQHARNGQGSP